MYTVEHDKGRGHFVVRDPQRGSWSRIFNQNVAEDLAAALNAGQEWRERQSVTVTKDGIALDLGAADHQGDIPWNPQWGPEFEPGTTYTPGTAFHTTIENCARCGGRHEALFFRRLAGSVGDLTHWAKCPTCGDPVLLKIVAETQPATSDQPGD